MIKCGETSMQFLPFDQLNEGLLCGELQPLDPFVGIINLQSSVTSNRRWAHFWHILRPWALLRAAFFQDGAANSSRRPVLEYRSPEYVLGRKRAPSNVDLNSAWCREMDLKRAWKKRKNRDRDLADEEIRDHTRHVNRSCCCGCRPSQRQSLWAHASF